MTNLHLDLGDRGYDITVGRGLLADAGKYFNLERKVFIVTDTGVPKEYAETVAKSATLRKFWEFPRTLSAITRKKALFHPKRDSTTATDITTHGT